MSDQSMNKKVSAVIIAAYLIAEAATLLPLIEPVERPRHKGGRRRKKTWMEKQQAKRGWGDKY